MKGLKGTIGTLPKEKHHGTMYAEFMAALKASGAKQVKSLDSMGVDLSPFNGRKDRNLARYSQDRRMWDDIGRIFLLLWTAGEHIRGAWAVDECER